MSYVNDFCRATGGMPFPYQTCFAQDIPPLVNVPTGLGKTAMAVIGWIWRRRFAEVSVRQATPRRLAYCLPMRVLVEQTRDNAIRWLYNLDKLAGKVVFDPPLGNGEHATGRHRVAKCTPPSIEEFSVGQNGRIAVYTLMGGEDEPEWDVHPERDVIIIGTQDMLLSRALNRGYAASRARWPMHFGLLNTDCLWVFDEIQLMGSGLATTAQLEAFRRLLSGSSGREGNGCQSVWMSATLRPDWLRTVDFRDRIDEQGRIDGKATLSLSDADLTNEQVRNRWDAKKPLAMAHSAMGDAAGLAQEIRDAHKPGTRSIAVVNTVKRARELFGALNKATTNPSKAKDRKKTAASGDPSPDAVAPASKLVLLHSRFRPPDRAERVAEALADVDPNDPGTIIVSTQVIEAGVDVSAATLFTELAPWPSLVQRFGRCNRRGEFDNVAAVLRWIGLPTKDADAEKARHPYELADLKASSEELGKLRDVGLRSLDAHGRALSDDQRAALFPHAHIHVIRRKDLLDLFDTTPDLAGNDIDIDRYVREIDETDVRVFWRDYGDPAKGATPNDIDGDGRAGGEARPEPAPLRDELCPAPIGEFKDFVKKQSKLVWRWNFTDKGWERAEYSKIAPGQVYLVHADAGGYSSERGWSGQANDKPGLEHAPQQAVLDGNEGYDDDRDSRISVWQTIAQHTEDVCREAEELLKALDLADAESTALRHAARWHDWGKAHATFQDAVRSDGRPLDMAGSRFVAKAPGSRKDRAGVIVEAGFWTRYARKHFRHELASALAVLQRPYDSLKSLSDDDLNLVAYLIAAHHGKVRLSIRSMPNEIKPRSEAGVPQKRFARGVWDGDELPGVDLGGGITAPTLTLSLEPMELGLCESEPFAGQPSWVERAQGLRDRLGPFRLAYLEAVLRAADERASAAASQPEEVNGA